MVYRALGVLFSDSGYSVAFSEFHENAGVWTFALKANNIFNMIDSLKAIDTSFKKIKLPSSSALKKLDRVSQVKKAENYVFLVKSYN